MKIRRRRNKGREYSVDNLGPLIVELVQMPHSLTELDGSHYEAVTYTLSLRVQNGRILAERYYISGNEEALERFKPMLRQGKVIEHVEEATWDFYDYLSQLFGRIAK